MCAYCAQSFYVPQWKLKDLKRNQGKYCSRACLYAGRPKPERKTRRYKRGDGYIIVYQPDHPDASKGGWILEHRLVAEQTLGRRLEKYEHVHHIDHCRDHNNPSNLEVLSAAIHAGESNRHAAQLREAQRREIDALRQQLAQYEEQFGLLPFHGMAEPLASRNRICKACGKAFIVNQPNDPGRGLYCSDACRLDGLHQKSKAAHASRRPDPIICQQCGQSFQVRAHRVGDAKYCSKVCADVAKELDNPEKPCERCGGMFRKRYRTETAKARFCSEACACRSITEARLKDYVPPKEKACDHCSQMFKPRWHIEAESARFCSRACYRAAKQVKQAS
jgi:hypothetical protein